MLAYLRPLLRAVSRHLGTLYPVIHINTAVGSDAVLDELRSAAADLQQPVWHDLPAWVLSGRGGGWVLIEQTHLGDAVEQIQGHAGVQLVAWGAIAALPASWLTWMGTHALCLEPDAEAVLPDDTLARHLQWEGTSVIITAAGETVATVEEIALRADSMGRLIRRMGSAHGEWDAHGLAQLTHETVVLGRAETSDEFANACRVAGVQSGLCVVIPLHVWNERHVDVLKGLSAPVRVIPLTPLTTSRENGAPREWPSLPTILQGRGFIGQPDARAVRGWTAWQPGGNIPFFDFLQQMTRPGSRQVLTVWSACGDGGRVVVEDTRIVAVEGVEGAWDPQVLNGRRKNIGDSETNLEACQQEAWLDGVTRLMSGPESQMVLTSEPLGPRKDKGGWPVRRAVMDVANWIDERDRGGNDDAGLVLQASGSAEKLPSTGILRRLLTALDGRRALWELQDTVAATRTQLLEAARALLETRLAVKVSSKEMVVRGSEERLASLLLRTGLVSEAAEILSTGAARGALSWGGQWLWACLSAELESPKIALSRWPVERPHGAWTQETVAALLDRTICQIRAGRSPLVAAHEVAEAVHVVPEAIEWLSASPVSLLAWAELSIRSQQPEAAADALRMIDRAALVAEVLSAHQILRAQLARSPVSVAYSS